MLTTNPHDFELLRKGETGTWQLFVAVYGPALWLYIRRRLPESETDDVYQDTLLKVLEALPTFEPYHNGPVFRTWLYVIARNAVNDWHRRLKRKGASGRGGSTNLSFLQSLPFEEGDEPGDEFCPPPVLRANLMATIQSRFSARDQAILRDKAAGMTCSEIQRKFGLKNLNTVHKVISRAISELKKWSAELGLDAAETAGEPPKK